MAAGVSGWIDEAARRAHRAIDWLHDLARRGGRREVVLWKPNGRELHTTNLTVAVVVLAVSVLLFLPLVLLVLLVGWLLGFRVSVEP